MATSGAQANGASRKASISDDGRFVAFETDATNLTPQDLDGHTEIVVRDRQLGTTVEVSLGGMASGSAFDTPDARMVSGDTNAVNDVITRSIGARSAGPS